MAGRSSVVNPRKAAHDAAGLFLDGLKLLHRFERIQVLKILV